jgi:hypothetical protein
MSTNVGQLTTEELKEIIGSVVEEKLKELLSDPDYGLEMRTAVRERLVSQQQEVLDGERGEDLDSIALRLGLS